MGHTTMNHPHALQIVHKMSTILGTMCAQYPESIRDQLPPPSKSGGFSSFGAIFADNWSGRQDSNLRPSGPKPDALPGCATPRPGGAIGRDRPNFMWTVLPVQVFRRPPLATQSVVGPAGLEPAT